LTKISRKILVAVDGSHYSFNQLSYLAMMFAGVDDVHFHLYRVVSGGSQPVGSEWLDDETRQNLLPAAVQKSCRLASKQLKEEAGILIRKGFSPEQIELTVQPSRVGIAADIVQEARKGTYDAIIMGRRGLGRIQELVLGSVTTSVLARCFDVPLWLLDGEVDIRRVLVPLDGSVHCLRAVDHLGFVLKGVPGVEITLFHSAAFFSRRPDKGLERFCEEWGKSWCDEYLAGPEAVFRGPEQILRESGFDMDNVIRADEGRGLDPARDIYLQIRYRKFGTVVMGRRLAEESKGFMGSVSGRVLRAANNVVVWLVH